MSKLLFLPDRNGREKESEGAGLVRLSADTSEMAALAKRMVIRQETGEITPDAAYQGAMALALLLVVALPAAYCLSRFRFKGRKLLNTLFMAGLFINVNYIVVPIFLMLRDGDVWLKSHFGLSLIHI